MPDPAKILGADDEADFEALIRQRFRRQIRDGEFTFRFAHHGEEALETLSAESPASPLLLGIDRTRLHDSAATLSTDDARVSKLPSLIKHREVFRR